MNAIDLLKQKLIEIGADGLYCDCGGDECGCYVHDLMPCEDCGNLTDCVPAKKVCDGLVPMKFRVAYTMESEE